MISNISGAGSALQSACNWFKQNPKAAPVAAGLAVTAIVATGIYKLVFPIANEQSLSPDPAELKEFILNDRGAAVTQEHMKEQVELDLRRQDFYVGEQHCQSVYSLNQTLRECFGKADLSDEQITTISFLGCQRVLTPLADQLGEYARTPSEAGTRSRFTVNEAEGTVTIESSQDGQVRQLGADYKTVIGNGRYELRSRAIYRLADSDFSITGTATLSDLQPCKN